jgi:hypothetical protein
MERRVSHLEAVTVCVGYDDFLKETARWNAPLFERWVVVTEPQDEKTRDVCRKFNIECLISEDGKRHSKDGEGFAKGRLVERGLQHLSAEGHRLHLDADMILPTRFRHLLDMADIQEDHIYGADRMMVKGWDAWLKVRDSGFLQTNNWDYYHRLGWIPNLEVGSRWTHPKMGYCPIGAFQLWHSSQDQWNGIRHRPYPNQHNNACRTDIQHALQWDRHKRALLPEVIAVHLESEPSKMGANWCGRTTKRFGPDKKPEKPTEASVS